jgi:hypothetical protein
LMICCVFVARSLSCTPPSIHAGRSPYPSQGKFNLRHLSHPGRVSSHFFRLSLQVQQPLVLRCARGIFTRSIEWMLDADLGHDCWQNSQDSLAIWEGPVQSIASTYPRYSLLRQISSYARLLDPQAATIHQDELRCLALTSFIFAAGEYPTALAAKSALIVHFRKVC